jgi:hypothetical protein
MVTIEVTTVTQFQKAIVTQYCTRKGFEYEMLDRVTLNVTLPEYSCDDFTEFLDENNIEWRLV